MRAESIIIGEPLMLDRGTFAEDEEVWPLARGYFARVGYHQAGMAIVREDPYARQRQIVIARRDHTGAWFPDVTSPRNLYRWPSRVSA